MNELMRLFSEVKFLVFVLSIRTTAALVVSIESVLGYFIRLSPGVETMGLKQFNCRYSLNDDRIIFRFNTVDHSEYIFWLTRRITHFILKSASQFIQNEYEKLTPTVANFISEIKQSDKQTTNFTTAYEPGVNYPLGGDPILVINAKCTMMKIEEQDVFSLDFILPGGANLNLKLPISIMKPLLLLLEELNVQANWGSPIG